MANRPKTKVFEIPEGFVSQHVLVENKHKQIDKIHSEIRAVVKSISASIQRSFEDNKGCNRCRGRGWVVTWDTLDSLGGSLAEYGQCPNQECTVASRAKSGLDTSWNQYDHNRGVKHPVYTNCSYTSIVGPLQTVLQKLEDQRSLIMQNPNKGDTVLVARGKGDVGFVGELFWMRSAQWGVRCGVKDKKTDKVSWTYLYNLDRLISADEQKEYQ